MLRLQSLVSALTFCSLLLLLATAARAESVSATVNKTTASGAGVEIGTVTFTDDEEGVVITTNLRGLPPGPHGFHVHQNPNCSPAEKDGKVTAAGMAGGHYDPEGTAKHMGPEGGGQKGDLPVLHVNEDGSASVTMRVTGVKAADFRNRSVMIHAGGDNYSDMPEALGGGGDRIACGVIR